MAITKLEDLKQGVIVKGLDPSGSATVVNIKWHGSDVVEIAYKDQQGNPQHRLLYRDEEANLEIQQPGITWGFSADGELFRLVSEAYRIRLAYLFDPWMAVHLSLIDPLPHQILAVYGEMLQRQPLRFLLADDPGAGKTIMTGLLIKELMLRGDLERCLIVAPGNLVEQWQDELLSRFHLTFEILTNDQINNAPTGNPFTEKNLLIGRMDKLSRDVSLQQKLAQADWDLVVVDEAHKMSASVFGNDVKRTKRYQLGELLSRHTRHFLLLTATPHNGKEEDFQLFLSLLDADRFEGRYREGVHSTDASDLMRRLVKEQLRKFDGSPLFPERRAYTVTYSLSPQEADLYEQVTRYVRQEFNRAESLESGLKGTVGFALTILQRRLASSPEAIYQSLKRRRERLESRLRELRTMKRSAEARIQAAGELPLITEEEWEEIEDAPEAELEETAEKVLDLATAAQTISELDAEIRTLRDLELLADRVRRSGVDRKWIELSRLLQEQAEMFGPDGQRRKLVIFTEHRDTLQYLMNKISNLLGKPEAVIDIHGGLPRDVRRDRQASFVQDKEVLVLVATDAAGEGINLQRAHLMINYDLPWNPVRLEQRFGRIHRIGQTEVCHLWNLVSNETREGDVYLRLLEKINQQRQALGDGVFDILGSLFQEVSLRSLLLDAIRYGDQPEVRQRLYQAVDNAADQQRVRELLADYSLAGDTLDISQVVQIREEFERAQARRLQPHFVASFFKAAFERLGGTIHPREAKRYEITRVPTIVRNRAREIGRGNILSRYERVTFHKEEINIMGKPTAEFLCPGHPLMDAVIDLILEHYRSLLKLGALLVDPNDMGEDIRALFYLEHAIQSGKDANRRDISRRLQFIEISAGSGSRDATDLSNWRVRSAGSAPFLDYQPVTAELQDLVLQHIQSTEWLKDNLEDEVIRYAVTHLVPEHVKEVNQRRAEMIQRTYAAVKDRLTKEIAYWDHRANELKAQEQAGKVNAHLNSAMARRRADDLQARLQRRLEELEQEKRILPQPPMVIGGALVIPAGLLARLQGLPAAPSLFAEDGRDLIEQAAMRAVMENEYIQGYQPKDVSASRLGWDIESRIPHTGKLRFIEVKGRLSGAETITVTKNEILAGLNKPEDFILAIVEVEIRDGQPHARRIHYLRRPFQNEPDFAATSVNFEIRKLLKRADVY